MASDVGAFLADARFESEAQKGVRKECPYMSDDFSVCSVSLRGTGSNDQP